MQVVFAPTAVPSGVEDEVHESPWAADIKLNAVAWLAENCAGLQLLLLGTGVEMKMHAVCKGRGLDAPNKCRSVL
ncbi:hypothetical protein D3C78_1612650 [compost metagenome]